MPGQRIGYVRQKSSSECIKACEGHRNQGGRVVRFHRQAEKERHGYTL